MIHRPVQMGAFHFVVLAKLRAAQLMRGCRPRVDGGTHKAIVTAQLEVCEGKVTQVLEAPALVGEPAETGGAPLEYAPLMVQRT